MVNAQELIRALVQLQSLQHTVLMIRLTHKHRFDILRIRRLLTIILSGNRAKK